MDPTEKQVAVGEFTVNYATLGSGDPLLLLHGGEHQESWRVWEPMMQLADSFRVVAPDLIGYGKSSKPEETPDHRGQAKVLKDLLDLLGVKSFSVVGGGWGGQVALEMGLEWPESLKSMALVASSYDKAQLPNLEKMRKPTLIVYAEDDLVTQLKGGYLLRDAIGTSRLEVLPAVARDPRYDFRMSHRLQKFRAPQLTQLVRSFLMNPESMVAEPPEMENELKGMALRKEEKGPDGAST